MATKNQSKKPATSKRKNADGLTDRQEAFIREYLLDFNATQAAIRAGYSKKGASVAGSQLLANPNILARVQQARDRHFKSLEVTASNILGELARVGFFNLRNAASWGPDGLSLKHSDDLDDDTAAAIASIESKPTEFGTNLKIKAHDKVAALKELAKIKGLYPKETKSEAGSPDDDEEGPQTGVLVLPMKDELPEPPSVG